MDYVVGSIANLISGNVTPSRPKQLKKAHTPIKHQPSPNVTPKSEFLDDRSIFLSPSMQKKKAIVKKSPKRIFQNPDLDVTNNADDSALKSPKADKVKKHLKGELEADSKVSQILLKSNQLEVKMSPKKKSNKKRYNDSVVENLEIQNTESEELVPVGINSKDAEEENISNTENILKIKKKKKKSKSLNGVGSNENNATEEIENTKKGSKKRKNNELLQNEMILKVDNAVEAENHSPKKKNKKNKKSKQNKGTDNNEVFADEDEGININAVTNKDNDSEHESDNEIESENEEICNTAMETGPVEEEDKSSDDEAPQETKVKKTDPAKGYQKYSDEELLRTIFVGNVPFSSRCKKEIKKIFNQYGDIETVRIRTVPVKDARDTPKLAVIKNEIHPDRTTVNVYVKFAKAESVEKALAANNTVLNDKHLRVSRSDSRGDAHDPKCAVFVGNIPFALEDDALRATFAKCGKIDSVRIIRDKKTNAGKGFGYVNFATKDGVELALALTEEDLTINNRILRVKRCAQMTQNKFGKKDKFKKQNQGNKQMGNFGKPNFGGKQNNDRNEGAYRRVMNKRKNQESGDGPPNKKQNLYQPTKDKKERKEFVGMTAEKKKKNKFDKGHKQKKALSEILTKK